MEPQVAHDEVLELVADRPDQRRVGTEMRRSAMGDVPTCPTLAADHRRPFRELAPVRHRALRHARGRSARVVSPFILRKIQVLNDMISSSGKR